jgi:hypothetical protein
MVDPGGRFVIPEVPDGAYRVHVWSERLPEVVRSIEVGSSGEATRLELEIGQVPGA